MWSKKTETLVMSVNAYLPKIIVVNWNKPIFQFSLNTAIKKSNSEHREYVPLRSVCFCSLKWCGDTFNFLCGKPHRMQGPPSLWGFSCLNLPGLQHQPNATRCSWLSGSHARYSPKIEFGNQPWVCLQVLLQAEIQLWVLPTWTLFLTNIHCQRIDIHKYFLFF